MRDREKLGFGVSVEGGPLAAEELHAVSTAVGEQPASVLWFEDFHSSPPVEGVAAVSGRSATPIITWEPWNAPLDSIARGQQDGHLTCWADALAVSESEVYLRFAHEFNGDWYPWSPVKGTSPEQFVAAWRHVHDLFRRRGVSNVRWVWSPNAVSTDPAPLAAWYPGSAYVDVLGVDGYNWGDVRPADRWPGPEELFDKALNELRTLDDSLPILIAEVACAECGGSKAEWISDFVAYADAQPDVVGFVWFEHDKETDWRLVSSQSAADAMAHALKGRAIECGETT
jgi:hypothetical protein